VHLESGLSSEKWNDPFPEELLRRLTFRKARYALCPNDDAAHRMEKYSGCTVVNTKENTLLDCVRFAAQSNSALEEEGNFFVASIHRFQNIYKRNHLVNIVEEMLEAAQFGDVHFILHPPTEIRLRKYNLYATLVGSPRVHVRPRMRYTKFLALLSGARGVFSDGGSNQEELSYLGVPTLLYRDRSERPDGLGKNIQLRRNINESMTALIESGKFDAMRKPSRINNDVSPSCMVVDSLLEWSGG
jgi:UDP-N-acetylglucosamine 2-epimerase (non-hydrolysing)